VTTAQDVLDQYTNGQPFALLGVAEDPRGSNRTPIGQEYGWDGVAWCMETVSVALTRAGLPFHRASTWFGTQDFINGFGTWLGKPDISQVRPGQVVFYGSVGEDHVGIVAQVSGNRIMTYEGNYADQCMAVWRDYSDPWIFGLGQPPYDEPATPEQPPLPPAGGSGNPPLDLSTFQPPLDWYLRTNYMRGDTIKIMQLQFNQMAGRDLDIDGVYGPATTHAVIDWQRFFGLVADGIVGPVTATHMYNVAVMAGWTPF
jgi:hypothetical protein